MQIIVGYIFLYANNIKFAQLQFTWFWTSEAIEKSVYG